MNVADFDFELPDELIAQEPAPVRGTSRLMALDRSSGRITHLTFGDLPSLLRSGDLLVVNDTRVFPARLIGTRLPGGGAAECFLIRPAEPVHRNFSEGGDTWIALVHPGQRLREGSRMRFVAGATGATGAVLHAEVVGRHFHGRRTVRLWTDDGSPVRDMIDAIGHVPLPPYIKRRTSRAIAIAIKPSTRAIADRSRRRRPACTSHRRFSGRSTGWASSGPVSHCMSATERFNRSASKALNGTRWKRSTMKSARPPRRC